MLHDITHKVNELAPRDTDSSASIGIHRRLNGRF
jgi:hypothetical protein